MARITEYNVINDHDLDDLITSVNHAIDDGWQPYGNLTVTNDPTEKQYEAFYTQAMVRYADE